MPRARLVSAVVFGLLVACAGGELEPIELALGQDTCASCRMVVSDARLAAQRLAPGEEPLVFDDLACLRQHLDLHPLAPGGVVFVADHRTGAWVPAAAAVYTRVPGLATPMTSSLVAHQDERSRDLDPATAGGVELGPEVVFGPKAPRGPAP